MAYTVSRISPTDTRRQAQVEELLKQAGLCRDSNLDYICGLFDEEDRLLATGGAFGPTLRCFAVDEAHRGEGLLNQIISHLMERQAEKGITHLFVYTKVENLRFFLDLGFYEIVRVGRTLSFLENRRNGFGEYCAALSSFRTAGRCAALVMNANPFTRGHQYLVERAAAENDVVQLFVLSEDVSVVPYAVRWMLVKRGTAHLANVWCHPSGPYLISNATFPSYFLQEEKKVIQTHAQLDAALFGLVAQGLGITVRYLGEEPTSRVTALYNQVMAQALPQQGIECRILPRLKREGRPVSASQVRLAIQEGRWKDVQAQVPFSTWEYLSSPAAQPVIEALQKGQNLLHY